MPRQRCAEVVTESVDRGRVAVVHAVFGVIEVKGHIQVEEGGVGDAGEEVRVRVSGREVLVEEGSSAAEEWRGVGWVGVVGCGVSGGFGCGGWRGVSDG